MAERSNNVSRRAARNMTDAVCRRTYVNEVEPFDLDQSLASQQDVPLQRVTFMEGYPDESDYECYRVLHAARYRDADVRGGRNGNALWISCRWRVRVTRRSGRLHDQKTNHFNNSASASRRKLCATLVFGHGAGPGCVDWSNAASTMSRVSHRKPQVCHPRKCSGRIRRTMGRGNTRYEGRFGNYPEAYRLTQIRYLSTR